MKRYLNGIAAFLSLILSAFSVCSASEKADMVWWDLKDTGRYLFKYDDPSIAWQEIQKERENWRIAMGEPKHLLLRYGTFPFSYKSEKPLSPAKMFKTAQIWTRDPDGNVFQEDSFQGKEGFVVKIPKNPDLNGNYLIGSRIDMDMAFNGKVEKVHFYAKSIVTHYKIGGDKGNAPDVFFNASDKMVLEIGPVNSFPRQTPHREYEMKVLYRGQPLANALVTVLTEGGWQKNFSADSQGKFRVTPLQSRFKNKHWEQYLYVVRHYDASSGEHHWATLPMIVSRPRPEWQSKSGGFMFWTISGTGLIILIVWATISRKKRRNRAAMVKFEKQRIKKG